MCSFITDCYSYHHKLVLVILFVLFSAAMAGRTELRLWRDMNRKQLVVSLWNCSLKRSPPLTTTFWSSGSAPTPVTHGFRSSGSTGFSAASLDTHKRTWIMHETAQVSTQFNTIMFPAFCLVLCQLVFWCMWCQDNDAKKPHKLEQIV